MPAQSVIIGATSHNFQTSATSNRLLSVWLKTALLLLLGISAGVYAAPPTMELFSGGGVPTVVGPSIAAQTNTYAFNPDNPSGTTASSTYYPKTAVTYTIENQQYAGTLANTGLVFGGDGTGTTSENYIYIPLSGQGAPTTTDFTSSRLNTNPSTGSGIDINNNYGTRFLLRAGRLHNNSSHNTTGVNNGLGYYFGDIVITWNRPVFNPVINISGLGGTYGNLGFAAQFQLSGSPAGTTISRLSGRNMGVSGFNITNTASDIGATADNGGSSGSIQVLNNNSITSLRFKVYVRSDSTTNNTSWGDTDGADAFVFSASSVDSTVGDLYVSKTNNTNSLVQGSSTTYTVRVTNGGPSTIATPVLKDSSGTGLTATAVVCSSASGNKCTAVPTLSSLSSGITIASLASGEFYEVLVTSNVTAGSGNVTNTATVELPNFASSTGASCVTSGGITRSYNSTTGTCTSTDTDSITPSTNLAITKTGTTSVKAGQPVSYTIKVWNKGSTAVTDAVMMDVVPNNISGVYLQCTATGTATCGTYNSYVASSNTRMASGISLPVDATGNTNYVTYTVSGLAYQTGSFTNSATISSAAVPESDSSDNTDSQATTITVDAPVTTGNAANQCLASQASNIITPITFTGYSNNNTTQTQSMTVNNAGTGYGTAANGAITVNGKISWSYGNPRITAATLTLYINNTAYAVLTTVGASSNGDQATWTALNGASITPATVALGSYSNANTTVPFTLTLPTSVTSVTSGYTEFKNISPTNASNMAGDDIGIAIDSIFQCQKPIIKIAKISTGGTGAFNFNSLTNLSNATNTAVTTDSVTTTTAGTAASSTQVNYATANNTAIGITEAATTNYGLTAASCTDANSAATGNTGSFGSLSGTTLSIPAANIKYGANLTCTFSNTKQRSLTLRKTWANARINDAATITATGLNSFVSTANTASETDTAAAQAVNVGSTITLGENISTGAGYYNAALSCTRNSDSAAVSVTGNNLTMPDADVTCGYTNTRKSAILTLSKIWSSGSIAGNTATVTSTGFGNNASSGTSTATAAGNTTTGTGVTVYAGESGTIGEAFGTGNASNYTATLACSGNSTALTGNSLTINPADTAINCGYTNTVTGADLAIDKTGSSSVTQGSTVSYSIKVWNKGPALASSSTFTDTVPAALTNVTWSCSASGSAVCGTASGTGNSISVTTGALPLNNVTTAPTTGSYLTFTITGTAASVGNISNTASIAVTSGTDPVTANNSSSASTTVNAPAALTPDTPQKEARFSITPDLPTIYRGQAGKQLVTIKNEGPDDASATVVTFKPRAQTGVTVTSVKVAGGANCSFSSGAWSCPVGSVANGGSFQLEVGYDTTASATLGTAIQADIKVASNEFNPGSGVGETLYKVWGSNTTNETRPNGAFWAGFKGSQGSTPASGYDDETTPIINAWPIGQTSPTGSYLVTAVPGINNNIYAASSTTANPMINRIITNMSTDPARSVTLPSMDSTSAGDNRRAWEFRTGVYVPQATNVTLCIGNTSVGIDDGAYIVLDNQVIGTQDSYQPNGYVSATVAFTTGYHTLSYRILNQNTQGGSAEVAQGLYGAIGILYNGSCNVAGYDAWVNTQLPASINIIEKPQVTITGLVFEDNSGSTAINSNAYNGIQDAGELGIADSVVSINNCNNTTAIATTKTDANGNYSFNLLPSDLPADSFCIAQTNLAGYSSVSGTTGYNRTADRITVSNSGASSYSNHNFGDARLTAILTEDGQQTIMAGGVADYPHRLTAHSVLTINSLNQTTSQQPANSSDQNWQALVYRDTNCNGQVDSAESLFSQSLPLTLKNAAQICLVQRVYAPATASMGAQHIGQLQASFSVTLADNSQIGGNTQQRQDTTLLGSAGLSMQKGVRSVASCPSTAADTGAFATNNQAQSGGYLEYEITYRNNSGKNLVDISIKDSVPTGTVYKTASCLSTPSGSCNASHTNGALLWQTVGTLLPNQQGKVRFCVQVP